MFVFLFNPWDVQIHDIPLVLNMSFVQSFLGIIWKHDKQWPTFFSFKPPTWHYCFGGILGNIHTTYLPLWGKTTTRGLQSLPTHIDQISSTLHVNRFVGYHTRSRLFQHTNLNVIWFCMFFYCENITNDHLIDWLQLGLFELPFFAPFKGTIHIDSYRFIISQEGLRIQLRKTEAQAAEQEKELQVGDQVMQSWLRAGLKYCRKLNT